MAKGMPDAQKVKVIADKVNTIAIICEIIRSRYIIINIKKTEEEILKEAIENWNRVGTSKLL